jgi:hypothetical protein
MKSSFGLPWHEQQMPGLSFQADVGRTRLQPCHLLPIPAASAAEGPFSAVGSEGEEWGSASWARRRSRPQGLKPCPSRDATESISARTSILHDLTRRLLRICKRYAVCCTRFAGVQTTTILKVLRPCGSRTQVRGFEVRLGTTNTRFGGCEFFIFSSRIVLPALSAMNAESGGQIE